MNAYEMNTRVPFYLCDENFNLRLDGYLKLFTESSVLQTNEKEDIKRESERWIIYKWDVEIIREAYWNDSLRVVTFARKIIGFYAYRNFLIYRGDELIARADTIWLLIGSDGSIKKIPKDLAQYYGSTTEEEDKYVKKTKKNNIKILDKYDYSYPIYIRASDLDYNEHVNNTNYLLYVMDAFKDLEGYIFSDIRIIFKRQIKYDEKIRLYYQYENKEDGKLYLYFIIKNNEDEIKTMGNIIWKEKDQVREK